MYLVWLAALWFVILVGFYWAVCGGCDPFVGAYRDIMYMLTRWLG